MALSVDRDAPRLVDRPGVVPGLLVAITVVGLGLRLLLARQDLFADELATYWIVTTRGFTGVIRTVSTTAEITPPLSFLLAWAAHKLASTPQLIRLPALLAGTATIPLVYALGLRTVGRRAALAAAGLTALSPFMIFYSAEGRGYGVLMFLLALSTYALLRAIDDGDWGWWGLYGACVCLATYTHYTGVFVLAVQVLWVLVVHRARWRRLLAATGAAALLYLPWLPSLRGDLDSPTTWILGYLSPLSAQSFRTVVSQWAVGFPFSSAAVGLRHLPGVPALVLLLGATGVGIYGAVTHRSASTAADGPAPGGPAPAGDHRLALIVLLAAATPAGILLQSVLSTNILSSRNLAASWLYLALAFAVLLTAGPPAVRRVAVVLALVAFGIGAVRVVSPEFQRPEYSRLADLADAHPGSVIVNGRSLTPGPLTNFEIPGSIPAGPVLRLFWPEQREKPFSLIDTLPDPADVVDQAVELADDGPIIVISDVPVPDQIAELVTRLPEGYERTDVVELHGIYSVQALVYERTGG